MQDFIDDFPKFEAVTDGVRVTTQAYFLAGQSEPENDKYVWAYRIRIANERSTSVQLLARHWIIIDGSGTREDIKGDGVIGEQPVIGPGNSHDYVSGTPLGTPTGFMQGFYQMADADGQAFSIEIPVFSLDSPYFAGTVN